MVHFFKDSSKIHSYRLQSQAGGGGPTLGEVQQRQPGRRAFWRGAPVSLIHPHQPEIGKFGTMTGHVCEGFPGTAVAKRKKKEEENTVERNMSWALRETLRARCQQIKFISSET